MKLNEINIRDPYIMVSGGKYYLYGTRSATCWGCADGFDCYTSNDLEDWTGPIEIFHRPEGFWADRSYWAPECYEINEKFYLVTTLAGENIKKSIHLLMSSSPTGPFSYVCQLSPYGWNSIDGTLHFANDGSIWMVFSHSFEDDGCQDMCAVKLRDDLMGFCGDAITLFKASEAPWAVPVPFAKAEFGLEGDIYFTDGPCAMHLKNGSLALIWSAWGAHGYAVGFAVSDNGLISGPWRQVETPLIAGGAGHGMVFESLDGKRIFTLHSPNDKFLEKPVFKTLIETDGILSLE